MPIGGTVVPSTQTVVLSGGAIQNGRSTTRTYATTLSITTGGTAQSLFASNSTRTAFTFVNTSSGNLRISDRTTASATVGYLIIPGGSYESPSHDVSTAAWSVWGATTGQTFESSQV